MSALYDNYKNVALGGGSFGPVNLLTNTIKVMLVNSVTDYTFDAAHTNESQVTHYLNTTDQTLANADVGSIAAGNFDNQANITFASVVIDGAKVVDNLVHFEADGAAADNALVCFHNGFGSVTPNGGDIVIVYDAAGIFTL